MASCHHVMTMENQQQTIRAMKTIVQHRGVHLYPNLSLQQSIEYLK